MIAERGPAPGREEDFLEQMPEYPEIADLPVCPGGQPQRSAAERSGLSEVDSWGSHRPPLAAPGSGARCHPAAAARQPKPRSPGRGAGGNPVMAAVAI
ncbi:unnamed protein product [Merluccius merluccius]